MCEQLTSVGINVREPYKLAIHTINSHSTTWHELKLETSADRCDWREMEWPEKNDQPTIRWRDEDDEETQVRVMDWVLSNWPTRNMMISHCLMHAKTVNVSGVTGLTTLICPNAKTVYASYATGLTTLIYPNAEYVYVSGATRLTTLICPNAEYVYVSGATGLTTLTCPKAEHVDVSGVTGLTTLTCPKNATVYR